MPIKYIIRSIDTSKRPEEQHRQHAILDDKHEAIRMLVKFVYVNKSKTTEYKMITSETYE